MAETKYKAVVSEIEEETKKKYVLLGESIIKDGATINKIDKDYVFSLKHLLLPRKMYGDAQKILQKLGNIKNDWSFGDTYQGDMIFSTVMQPEMKKCIAALKKEEFCKALTSLISMFFVFRNDEGWIRDNESWSEISFPKLFKEYSLCWKIMLGSPGGETELIYKGGLPDGYKDKLLALLQEQQDEVMIALEDIHDCFDEDQIDMRPTLDIVPLPDVPLTIDNLPSRKPQTASTTKSKAKSQRPKPKTKKPQKPSHFWFSKSDSEAHKQKIMNSYMAQWQEDVKKWEKENEEYLKPKTKIKKITEKGTSKNTNVKKPKPASTKQKENVPTNIIAKKGTTKRKAQKEQVVSKTAKKSRPSKIDAEEPTPSGSNINEGEAEGVVNQASTVTRSGRKCNPVLRF